MKKWMYMIGLALALSTSVIHAHELFLKLSTFFLNPHSNAVISLINGTFEKSENAIARHRMIDVSIVGPETQVIHPDTSQWHDQDNMALLQFKTGDPGTYIAAVSTASRVIALSADDFNEYLKHDGILDILAVRERNNELNENVRERYSKHVKAIIQVGDMRTGSFNTRLGYPIELVPSRNPYNLKTGDMFEVILLKGGNPVENHLVYASYEGYRGREREDVPAVAIETRTDENGIAQFELQESGRWYITVIHMIRVHEEDVNYESNWATLTFEIL